MSRRLRGFSQPFDALVAAPLAVFALMVMAMLISMIISVTGPAIRQAFSDSDVLYAVWLSLATSAVSAFLSIVFAVPIGYVLSRRVFPGRTAIDSLLDLPVMLPPLVLGLCVLIFFNTTFGRSLDRMFGFVYTWRGIILVQFITGCSLAIRVVKAGFDHTSPEYENVAMVLGADRARSFFKVALPIARKSVVAGLVLAWARIFGMFGPVLMIAGTMRRRTEIMPTTVYLEASVGRIEVALVIGLVLVAISYGAMLLLRRFGGEEYV